MLNLEDYFGVLFEVEGWTATFRYPNTVTTQVTQSIPSKTAMLGFLFAKVGIGRSYIKWPEIYGEYLQKIKTAISFNNKKRVSFFDYVNYINKDGKTGKPTFIEYLVNPKFTFVFLIPKEDSLLGYDKKNEILTNEKIKTFLGTNENPAEIKSCKEIKFEIIRKNEIKTRFVIENEKIDSIKIDNSYPKFVIENIPFSSLDQSYLAKEMFIPIGNELELQLKNEEEILIFDSNELMVV